MFGQVFQAVCPVFSRVCVCVCMHACMCELDDTDLVLPYQETNKTASWEEEICTEHSQFMKVNNIKSTLDVELEGWFAL